MLRPGPGATSYPDLSPALVHRRRCRGSPTARRGLTRMGAPPATSRAAGDRRRGLLVRGGLGGRDGAGSWRPVRWVPFASLHDLPAARAPGGARPRGRHHASVPTDDRAAVRRDGRAGRRMARGVRAVERPPVRRPVHTRRSRFRLARPRRAIDFARLLATAGQLVTIAAGLGLAGWAVGVYARSTTVARRRTGRTLAPAVLVGLAWAASAVALTLPSSLIPPLGDVMVGLFVVRAATAAILGVGLAGRSSMGDGRSLPSAESRTISRRCRAAARCALPSRRRWATRAWSSSFPLPDGAGFVDASGASVTDPSHGRAGIAPRSGTAA